MFNEREKEFVQLSSFGVVQLEAISHSLLCYLCKLICRLAFSVLVVMRDMSHEPFS